MSLYSSYPLYDSYLPMQDLSGFGSYYPETLYSREQMPLMDWSMAPMERGLGYPETLYTGEQMPLMDRSLMAPMMERGLGYTGEQMPLMDLSMRAPTERWLDYDRPSDWGMRSRELAPKEDRSLWRGAMGGMTEMGAMGGWQPRCTMRSTDEGLLVEASLPGVKLDDIDLRLVDGDLVLSGERREEITSKDEGYWSKERSYGKFRRRMWLPEGVQLTDIRANFNNGVLQVLVLLPGLQSGEGMQQQQQQQLGQGEVRRMEEPKQTYAEWGGAQAQRQAEPTIQTVVGEPTVPRSEEAGPVREEGTREETKPLLEKKEKEKEKLEKRSSGIFIGNEAPTTGQSAV